MRRLILILVISIVLSFIPQTTLAQYIGAAAQPARGLLIEKRILNPQNNQFVDNLNIDQQTFLPNNDVIFKITVSNVIQSDLKNLTITDFLPSAVLNFVSASEGSCDSPCKIVTLKVDSLKVGESKNIEIRTKVKGENELGASVSCQTNLGRVTINNIADEDTATFCVSKQVLGVTSELPKTGSTQTFPILTLSVLLFAIGLLMKRIIFLEGR